MRDGLADRQNLGRILPKDHGSKLSWFNHEFVRGKCYRRHSLKRTWSCWGWNWEEQTRDILRKVQFRKKCIQLTSYVRITLSKALRISKSWCNMREGEIHVWWTSSFHVPSLIIPVGTDPIFFTFPISSCRKGGCSVVFWWPHPKLPCPTSLKFTLTGAVLLEATILLKSQLTARG